jgi:catechol 2,3-dioxygenase
MMEAVRFAPRRLGHVNLYVSDLARSIQFYERVCGLRKVRSESAIRAGFLSNGNTHHDLGLIEVSRGDARLGRDGKVQISSTRGTRPGLNHLGWEMENEAQLIAAYRRLIAAGLKPTALFDHLVSHAVYVADPDGNVHEFYADMMNDWQKVFNLDTDDLVTSQWDPLAAPPCEQSFYVDPSSTSAHPDGLLPSEYVTGACFTTHRFDAMQQFMTEVAGLRLLESHQPRLREAIFGGSRGRPEVRLTEVDEDQPVGFRSFAVKVERGAAEAGRFAQLPADALGARLDTEDRIACVLRDPDGCEVEVYEPRGPAVLAPSSRASH